MYTKVNGMVLGTYRKHYTYMCVCVGTRIHIYIKIYILIEVTIAENKQSPNMTSTKKRLW